jgi:hypothetical protein
MATIRLPSYFMQSETGEVLILCVKRLFKKYKKTSPVGEDYSLFHFLTDQLREYGITWFLDLETNRCGLTFEHTNFEYTTEDDELEKSCPYFIDENEQGTLELTTWRRNWVVKSEIPIKYLIPNIPDFETFDEMEKTIKSENQTITFYEQEQNCAYFEMWQEKLKSTKLTPID